MDFDDDAALDTSRVDDTRGSGGFIPGGGKTIGGGVVALLLTVVLGLLGVNGSLPGVGSDGGDTRALTEKCAATNPDRFREADCRQIATFNDLRAFWGQTLAASYRDPRFHLFSQGVNTACGQATSAVGPFYCPADQKIYIDLGFYDELGSRFGAPGEFAQAYVMAHEFGHHVQTLTGTAQQVRRLQQRNPDQANEYSIAMELQADCYAGVWTHAAASPDGLVGEISDADITEALQAAAAVGDDRIQQQAGGGVNPETWTHGSAAQRQQWFSTGYRSGDPRSCNTFAVG